MGEEALLDSPDAESGLKTSDEERKSLLVSFLSILISIPALIGACCWPALVIGLVSGTASAAARSLGHYIALSITGFLMLIVGYMLFRAAMWGPRSFEEVKWRRWGPMLVFSFAYPMIIADPLRHVLGDTGLWPGCGNNPVFPRINSSNPYPPNCATSSYEYHCTIPCCVPVWLPDGSSTPAGVEEYKWFPNQTSFFPAPAATLPPGQFATLTASGQLFEPPSFDPAVQPYQVYDGSKPLIFYETGELNTAFGPESPETCKPYGYNNMTGYCLMTSEDPSVPSLLGPDGSCDCMGCVVHETMSMLSPMGILITAFFTYFGFFLLSVAVLWNADIVSKLKGVREKWRQLRALQKSQAAAAAPLHSPLTAEA